MKLFIRFLSKFKESTGQVASLDKGWIIANHKLVSFHAAFLTSLFSITQSVASRTDVLYQMFLSREIGISAAMWYLAWHANIAIHEMGHYLSAVKTNNLRPELNLPALEKLNMDKFRKWLWYLEMFIKIPWGAFEGITKEAGSFHPAVKAQNLAVSAAGPGASRTLCIYTLPAGILLVFGGHFFHGIVPELIVYGGRFLFTIGIVALFDFLLADPGKYREFRKRQREALKKATNTRAASATTLKSSYKWSDIEPAEIKNKLEVHRLQEIILKSGKKIAAPWEFRNSIMGGRHTEEMGGNLSFQEFMFLPLTAKDYIEAQRIINALQSRVIQIIQDSEGLNFVGIGLEGGVVASYTRGKDDILPEERALKVAVQSIEECGFTPDRDVCLAIDSAASELSNAYRQETGKSEAVGQYLFWRAEDPRVMTTDELLEMYMRWIREYPIISLEDPFAEDDFEGWKKLMNKLGNEILIIGDDLVTTKDSTIARCADEGLINAALIKANQIGTLTETMLATSTAKKKGLALIVSHRSKSPNEVMEADIGFAVKALGLKCGGGSNTERLIKYGRIVELMQMAEKDVKIRRKLEDDLVIADISAREEPTNAGIPSVGVTIMLDNGMKFSAATPLGTSAGMDEAVHLVDSIIEKSPVTEKFPEIFEYREREKTYRFAKHVDRELILSKNNSELAELWMKASRYDGRGCLNAVFNLENIIAPRFIGKKIGELGNLIDIDRQLLALELRLAMERGKIPASASADEKIYTMQRKGNLGMNAILSCSLALGRLIAARNGLELPDILEKMENNIDRNFLYSLQKEVFQNRTLSTRPVLEV